MGGPSRAAPGIQTRRRSQHPGTRFSPSGRTFLGRTQRPGTGARPRGDVSCCSSILITTESATDVAPASSFQAPQATSAHPRLNATPPADEAALEAAAAPMITEQLVAALTAGWHEAAHGLAGVRGSATRPGRAVIHNKRFKALGEELGLVITEVDKIGWSGTALGPALDGPGSCSGAWSPRTGAAIRGSSSSPSEQGSLCRDHLRRRCGTRATGMTGGQAPIG